MSTAAASLTSPNSFATELHERLLDLKERSNVLRKRFFDALRSLAESRLFLHLGYPTIHAWQPIEEVRRTESGALPAHLDL